ncbi:MAG TPA: hypothetical protein VGI39_31155 [Polyangiaceae bacterium]
MMKRILATLLFAGAVTATVAACDDGSGYYETWNGSSACHQDDSCGTCTPVQGCGWCVTSTGQGICAADPDECANYPAFRWAWNPDQCTATTADASVGPSPDSGTPVPTDASLPDVSRPPPVVDAGPSATPDASPAPPDANASDATGAIDASDASSASD